MRHAMIAALLALAACTSPAPQGVASRSEVAIAEGKLEGVSADGVLAWKGIPFAAPPMGDLRWRAPQPPAHWSGVRSAADYGHDCMQQPFPSDAAPLGTPPAEDCLYLNVWRPDTPSGAGAKALPVMVWIYGGGFVNGGSSPPTYSGALLAKQGIVVVSFNYRLGRFGFFAHPALTSAHADDTLLGNYGYMDQIAALKWVQANVRAFGGDPSQVTLVGESAGGGSVHTMVTSPRAKGLFSKAVVMSGGGRGNLMGEATITTEEKVGLAFAKSKGITGDGPDALAKLRALSAEEVTSGLSMAALARPGERTFSTPMVDGWLVVEDADAAYRNDHFSRVPMMIGTTSNDIGGRLQAADKEALFAQFPDPAKARAAFDPKGEAPLADVLRRASLATGSMVEPARYINATLSAKGVTSYEYRFSYVAESLRTPKTIGAGHASDIPFFFDTQHIKYGAAMTPKDDQMGRTISSYIVNFVKTGDPNGAGLPKWERFSPAADPIMDFTMDGIAKPGRDPWEAELDAAKAWFEHRK